MDGAIATPAEGVSRLLRPVAAGGSGGAASRLGEHFDRIRSEIAKLGGPGGADAVDWSAVAERAEALLESEGKDLHVAACLVLAWSRLRGLEGVQRGFELVAGLLQEHWEAAFPPLDKTSLRAEILSWMAERLAVEMTTALRDGAAQAREATGRAFVVMREVVRRRFPDRGPALGPVARALLGAGVDGVAETAIPLEGAVAPTEEGVLAPLAGEDPAGVDPWLCDEFEALRQEIAKAGSIHAHDVAWSTVAELSRRILSERAKDLRCLTYRVVAQYRIEGAPGLQAALSDLARAAEIFGERLHPRRTKARAGAMTWLGERLQAELLREPPVLGDGALREIRATLASCRTLYAELAEGSAGLSVADEALAKVRTRPGPLPASSSAVDASAFVAAATPSPSIAAAPVVGELATLLLERARTHAASGEDATSLRLRRLALWMDVPAPIPSKKLECDVGTLAQQQELAALEAGAKWAELLAACESLVEQFPLWIDLTCWSIRAAEQVVSAEAAAALRGELVALTLRHPTLTSSFDRKGRWLASRPVREWISRELTPRPPAPVDPSPAEAAPPAKSEAPPAAPAPAVAADPHALPPEIEERLRARKLEEAMTRAKLWWDGSGDARTRFARSLAVGRACIEAGELAVALPLFRGLAAQLPRFEVGRWDPSLVASCLGGLLACKRGLKLGLAADEGALDELALLDPAAITGVVR